DPGLHERLGLEAELASDLLEGDGVVPQILRGQLDHLDPARARHALLDQPGELADRHVQPAVAHVEDLSTHALGVCIEHGDDRPPGGRAAFLMRRVANTFACRVKRSSTAHAGSPTRPARCTTADAPCMASMTFRMSVAAPSTSSKRGFPKKSRSGVLPNSSRS